MKVIILTEAGKDIGFGHLTRCVSLYEAFEENKIIPQLIINGDNSVKTFLKDKDCQIFNWLKEKDRLFGMMDNTDIVIIDSYLTEKSLYDRISDLTSGRIVMIDDCNRLKYPKGIVVNPSIYGDKLNYPQEEGRIYLLGKDYIILRKEFWNIPKKKINKEVRNILITFGGMNHSDLIYKIINYLKDNFDFNLHIVEPNDNKLSAKGILNLMLKADICISGGGQTTYELARCGLPTIGICFAENQILNLKGWAKREFLEFIGWYRDKRLLSKLEKAIKKLNCQRRRQMSCLGQSLLDGQGAGRMVKEILQKIKA